MGAFMCRKGVRRFLGPGPGQMTEGVAGAGRDDLPLSIVTEERSLGGKVRRKDDRSATFMWEFGSNGWLHSLHSLRLLVAQSPRQEKEALERKREGAC